MSIKESLRRPPYLSHRVRSTTHSSVNPFDRRHLRFETLEDRKLLTTSGFEGPFALDNWVTSGIFEGTTSITPAAGESDTATFGYNVDLGSPGPGVPFRTADFTLQSSLLSGSVTFDYEYTGDHLSYLATARFQTLGATSNFIVDAQDPFSPFSFTGSTTINFDRGDTIGFRIGGQNVNIHSRLFGDLTITNFQADASLVVDSLEDTSDGDFSAGQFTLREAIEAANAAPGADTITFSSLFDAAHTIALASQLPTITEGLTIEGPDANLLTIDAGNGADNTPGTADGFRIFNITDGDFSNQIDVGISGLALTGGDVPNTDVFGAGGAIVNQENLSITSSTISGNSATNGGGIYNFDNGALTLTSSTISGNFASSNGGAVFNYAGGTTAITSSTLSTNSATFGGGISSRGVVTITDSTLNENSAATGGGGAFNAGAATITNSIVANSTTGGDLAGPGSFAGSFNLIEDGSGSGLTDTVTGAPLLGPLQDNGGPTPTHALLFGSPAIDTGSSSQMFDQRGFARNIDGGQGGGVDIGAFEALNPLLVTTSNDVLDVTDAVVSLREAIANANTAPGANTITFAADVFTGGSANQLLLGGTELVVTDTLTIDASALTEIVTLDAQQNSRVLNFMAASGDLMLDNLMITGGLAARVGPHGSNGGGILFSSSGDLYLTNSTVSGNSTGDGRNGASGGQNGGRGGDGVGLYTDSGSVLLTNSTVSGNSTGDGGNGGFPSNGLATPGGSGGRGGDGGGIFTNSGSITLTRSTVSGNSTGDGRDGRTGNDDPVFCSGSGASGNGGRGGSGGGIFTNSGLITFTSSTVSNNATGDGGVGGFLGVGGEGGDGGGIFSLSGSVSLTRSTVSENSTGVGGVSRRDGDGGDGGGIFAHSGSVTLTRSTVSENSTGAGGRGQFTGAGIGGLGGRGGDGGGLFADSGLITISSSTISGNSTGDGGVGGRGGGASLCQNNYYRGGAGGDGGSGGDGGGIFSNSDMVTITSSTINENSTGVGGDGGLGNSDEFADGTNGSDGTGGGIRSGGNSAATIINSIVANSASGGDLTGAFTGGFNLIGDAMNISALTNTISGNPLLGPLADNGGLTLPNGAVILTHALLPGSPAINEGDNTVTETEDQRGFARNSNGVDIGAYELQITPSADFDSDGDVDGADFLAWQRGFGTINATRPDGNSDQDTDTDASDLAAWQVSFGQQPPSSLASSQPSVVSSVVSSEQLTAKSEQPLSNAAIIDAAMALAIFEREPVSPTGAVVEASFTEEVTVTETVNSALPVTNPASDLAGQVSSESEAIDETQPWLDEEQLAAVFG